MTPPGFLTELCVRSLLLSGAGFALLAAARLTNASWRHTICAFVLGGLLVLPPVLLLPGWRMEMGPWAKLPGSAAQTISQWQFAWLLAGVWFAGTVWHLTKLSIGLRRLRQLAENAQPVTDQRIVAAFADACEHLKLTQIPSLRLGKADQMPLAFGLGRGIVLLPAGAADWSDDKLELVLLHELGHLKRRDPMLQALGLVACAVHWFNPLVWLFHKRLRQEREFACDAMVIAAGVSPVSYARVLLDSLTSRRTSPAIPSAALGGSDLKDRIQKLLAAPKRRSHGPGLLAAMLLMVGSCAVLAAGLLHPRILEIMQLPPGDVWTPADVAERFEASPFPAEPGLVR